VCVCVCVCVNVGQGVLSVCMSLDLAHMYQLLSPIQNGLTVLVQELEEFIKQTAIDTVRPLLTNNV